VVPLAAFHVKPPPEAACQEGYCEAPLLVSTCPDDPRELKGANIPVAELPVQTTEYAVVIVASPVPPDVTGTGTVAVFRLVFETVVILKILF